MTDADTLITAALVLLAIGVAAGLFVMVRTVTAGLKERENRDNG